MCYVASHKSTKLSYTLWSGFPKTQCGNSRKHRYQQSGIFLPRLILCSFYCSFYSNSILLFVYLLLYCMQLILKTHTSAEGPICKLMYPQPWHACLEQPRLLTSRSGRETNVSNRTEGQKTLQCIFTDVENSIAGVLNHGNPVVLVRLKARSVQLSAY